MADGRPDRRGGSAGRGGSSSAGAGQDRSGKGDRQGRSGRPVRRAASRARVANRAGVSNRAAGGQPRRPREPRSGQRAPSRPGAPPLPPDVSAADLDPQVRRELRTLPKGLADEVAARLVASTRLVEDDPEAAYPHAAEAARIASRVAATREALGVVAYATGRWAQARTELRAAARLSGSDVFLPMIADCERGLGRPDRALEIAKSPAAAGLDRASAVEMRIVASGARRDMGQLDAAVLTLQTPDLRAGTRGVGGAAAVRLCRRAARGRTHGRGRRVVHQGRRGRQGRVDGGAGPARRAQRHDVRRRETAGRRRRAPTTPGDDEGAPTQP